MPRCNILIAPAFVPNFNPAVRVYHIDDETFELLDYDQYYTDLKQIDNTYEDGLTWLLEYSARLNFELSDLSPMSWKDFDYRVGTNSSLAAVSASISIYTMCSLTLSVVMNVLMCVVLFLYPRSILGYHG